MAGKFRVIDPQIKADAIAEVKNQGMPVSQAAIRIDKSKAYVNYYLVHHEELLLHHDSPVLQAKYIGVIFNKATTYDEVLLGPPDCRKTTGVNKIFVPKTFDLRLMAGLG